MVRTDRDLRAIGKVGDLVPTAPPIAVGDSGHLAGRAFRVAGRVQLDHGRGPWDEWYIAFGDGAWSWLAKAQGRWFLTSAAESSGLPGFEALYPGAEGSFAGTGPVAWTVQEQGASTLVSGEGELPFPIAAGERGRFVDLAGPNGAFATIDYGDGSAAPKLFAGRELHTDELDLAETAGGPRPEEKVELGKLTCPTCGAPVEIRSESTERAACAYCYSLLDLDRGNLRFLEQLQQPKVQPLLALGSTGTLEGEALTVLAFMQRYTVVDGITYAWSEYLLHGQGGYRWLMEDNGHWAYLRPISPGDVSADGYTASYDGKTFKAFQRSSATVRFVIGELYWKVAVGERTTATDYVSPPLILSEERNDREVVWSAGTYLEPKTIEKAFGVSAPRPSGVAPAQPNPHPILATAITFAILMVLFMAMALGLDVGRTQRVLVDGPLLLPPTQAVAGATQAEDRASYTPPFTVTSGPTTLEVELNTSADNDYVGVACALVNEDTGEVREFYVSAEYNHGVTGGESWTEGDRHATVYVDRVPAGRYTMRLDPQWSHWNGPMTFAFSSVRAPPGATIKVVQGSRSGVCCCFSFLLLLFPLPIVVFRRSSFEKRRWDNSNLH